jgi:hypothetical protein
MRNLLSSSFQRKLNLIDFLYSSPYKKTKDIKKYLNYNMNTFLNDVSELNNFIYPCEIIQTQNSEYFIFFPANTNIEYIYLTFLKEALEFRLLKALIDSTYTSTEQLAESLFVSNSTLKRTILRINKILDADYGFKISTSPMTLIGDEEKIIAFIIIFLKEYYVTSSQLLTAPQEALLKQIFEQLTTTYYWMADIDRDKFNFYVYSIILRFKQHSFFVNNKKSVLFDDIKPAISELEKVFAINVNESLIYTLESLLLGSRYILSYEALVEQSAHNLFVKNQKIKIEALLSYLSDTFSIDCAHSSEIVLKLYNYTALTYAENYVLFPKYKYFLENLTQHFSYFYELIAPFIDNITSYTAMERSYEFIYQLVIHWPELQLALERLNPQMNVGIYFFTDIEHNQFMKTFFENYFAEKITIEILFTLENSFDLNQSEDFDLLITNLPLPEGVHSDKIICCSLFPTSHQLDMINEYYMLWAQKYF